MSYFSHLLTIYQDHIVKEKEEPRFLLLVSFTFTFIFVRFIVYSIHHHYTFLPFRNISIHSNHVHHLVIGILLLLFVGLWRVPSYNPKGIRAASILYGIGAGLTLDEFALWLRLQDVYFASSGRLSIDAIVIFLLITFATFWHGVFWRKVISHTVFFFMKK